MNTKTVLSLVFSASLALAILGNLLFAKKMLLAIGLVLAVLGVGILAHLAFFEEKKKHRAGPVSWLNLGMSYGTLLMSLVYFLLPSDAQEARDKTIAKAGQVAGDETDGSKVPLSDRTNVDSGGDRAKLGSVGRGEGEETLGGANEDNQNAMREAQVHDPDIAGADQVFRKRRRFRPKRHEVVEPGDADLGLPDATDNKIERVGQDNENQGVGDPNALRFDEDDQNTLAFDSTVFRGKDETPLDLPKAKGETVRNFGVAVNSLGIAVPKSMSGRCDKLGRVSRLTRAGVRKPESVERAVIKALDWLTAKQNDDGSWGKTYQGAMTGFALLCYLGHCELTDSPEYGEAVSRGIKYLVELGDKKDGWLYVTTNKHGAAYTQGIATYALAEAYGMTEKDFILPVLQKAIHRIVAGQKEDGGWYYLETRKGPANSSFVDFGKNKNAASDTSVSGWQLQALKAATIRSRL